MDVVAPRQHSTGVRSGEACDLITEEAEQVARVMGSGRRLRMELHGEHVAIRAGQTLDGAVVQVDVRDLGAAPHTCVAHCEAVVLGRYLDDAAANVLDGMIGAAMAELELERFQAQRQCDELMTKTDAEDGHLAEQLPD